MPKVYHLTLALEMEEGTNCPTEWDWPEQLLGVMPGLEGLALVSLEQRPYPTMDEDPMLNTQH